jgi:hypothetical protein
VPISIHIVVKKSFINFEIRIDDFPLVFSKAVAFYVGREIPLTETTANSTKFINEFISPRNGCVRGRGIIQAGNSIDLLCIEIKAEARLCHSVHIFVAANYINDILNPYS